MPNEVNKQTANNANAMKLIRQALAKAVNEPPEIIEDTDLAAEDILDSLDAMVFIAELERLSGKKFPETDLEEAGFFKTQNLVDFLDQE